MPAKKPPKSGKKLSKAEKERLKKEEAERKAQEEEEAAKQAERDAIARKEREKVEAEERRVLENAERKKRKGQLQELEEIWSSYRNTLFSEQQQYRVKAKWDRYMRCDGSPDPTIPGEINAYINLLLEDHSKDNIESVLQESQLILELIAELEYIIEDTPPHEYVEETTKRYKQTIRQLQNLLKEKLDLASHQLSLDATKLIDAETLNLQQTIEGQNITLCMWGNLSKNPRIKSFEFEKTGFLFEMPKVLTLSDIAFRVLFTKYDHYSEYSSSFKSRVKVKPVTEEPAKEPTPELAAAAEGGEGEEKKEETEQEPVSREETEDVMAALNSMNEDKNSEDGENGEEQENEQNQPEVMEEDYEIKTPEPVDYEDFDGDDDVVDLRAFHIVGGVFYFNLLNMPPQPKQANAWTLTQTVDPPRLQYNDYEGDPPEEAQAEETKDEDITKAADKLLNKKRASIEGSKSIASWRAQRLPIAVVKKLPADVYFFEEPQVVRWHETTNEWRIEGFSEQVFKEDERLYSFKTRYFGTMALIQDKHINMPFQSWEIRPKASNHAIVTIIAAIAEVEMEIKDDKICMSQPEDKDELKHLVKKWYPIKDFIKKMQQAGLNLFPDEDSFKYVSLQNKNPITEERLYQQIAMVASSMAFSWSRWNSDCEDQEKIVIQGVEQLVDEPLLEEDWQLFMISKKRTTKLKMTEFDEVFSEDHMEGTEFHADLYHMTMDTISEEGKARIRETNHLFVDSVYQFLSATKLVTYS